MVLRKNNFKQIKSAELVLPCIDLDKTLEFFIEKLGFMLISIFPADNPKVAIISGYDLQIRLERNAKDMDESICIRLNCSLPESLFDGEVSFVAPNGVRIELVDVNPPINMPELKPSLVINRFSEDSDWINGRAGMRYRDLIPDRLGGYLIASHIHVQNAGPVPDYVHFHKIHFQMIYCHKGWAKLVYEDQGEPFIFSAGDCVLQPPQIRHRVLESSENLEVIEISSPAEHETFADNKLKLPTQDLNPNRNYNGQKFVHHKVSEAIWKNWRIEGFEFRDTGIGLATDGLLSAGIIRFIDNSTQHLIQQDANLVFVFILQGSLKLSCGKDSFETLKSGDSFVLPNAINYSFLDCSKDLELLEVKVLK